MLSTSNTLGTICINVGELKYAYMIELFNGVRHCVEMWDGKRSKY